MQVLAKSLMTEIGKDKPKRPKMTRPYVWPLETQAIDVCGSFFTNSIFAYSLLYLLVINHSSRC